MKIFLSIGGASGSIYGIRLIQELKNVGAELYLTISDGAKKIITHETNFSISDIKKLADFYYDNSDMFSGPASGSFKLDSMVVCPCSMKTLSAIANGYGDKLTSRAAICTLKEDRKLILVPRETPLDLTGIKNMEKARLAGAVILPAMPGFYHRPKKIDDLVDFLVGKILDQLDFNHSLFKRWK